MKEAESRKNEGATISFTLRFGNGIASDFPREEMFNIGNPYFKNKRILLVENHQTTRLIANTIFSNYGAEIVEVDSDLIVLEKVQESKFDLLLTDISIPVMNGCQTARFIRASINNEIPIIALTTTALDSEHDVNTGMTEFGSGRQSEYRAVRVVARWPARDWEPEEIIAGQNATAPQLFSIDKLLSIGRGNTEFVRDMLELFIQKTPETLEEMELALNKSDWVALSRWAHQIKPSLHNMGIASLQNDVYSLENTRNGPGNSSMALMHLDRIKSVTGEVIEELKVIMAGDMQYHFDN